MDALPLEAAETPVSDGVEIGDLTENVALRLAVYAAEENAPV